MNILVFRGALILKEMFHPGILYVEEHGEIRDRDVCCEVDISKKIGFIE